MFQVLSNLSKLSKQQEDGQGLVEYALILVLVAVVVVVVLSLVGPAVGNIFSEVVSVLNGGEAESNSCVKTGDGRFVIVDNGAIPGGTYIYPNTAEGSKCEGPLDVGYFDFDSVKVSAGASVATATAACQSHFGKTLRFPNNSTSEIWGGSGFWYCTP